ncbi:MAG: DJ-1/PfpI family protein [Planctomycetes bacterium]|nr:DJ-1/PfpI family protein [Planctomycetota bacterium]MBI3844167.1 DJ-1/PfpI family protein [Planctomycetota bacterium]
MSTPSILIVTGDAAEALEVMYPLQRLREEGFAVTLAAPTKKVLQSVVHDFEPGFDTYTEKLGYRIPADVAFADVDPARFDALVIPGGRAPEWIRNDKNLARIVRHFFDEGKPVAAICHAALILAAVGVVRGRTMTAYPAIRPEVESAGATFKDVEVVVDRNLVTSRAWPDHPAFLREFLKLVRGEKSTKQALAGTGSKRR